MIQAKVRRKLGELQLSAEIDDDRFICVAGRNGSGKTSLFRAIAGLLAIDEGYVRVGGADVALLPADRRDVIMVTPSSFFAHLDVDSHLVWGARLRRRQPEEDKVARVKALLGIDFGGRVGRLSLGMRSRVALATAFLASPKVILVDEAFSNLHERERFMESYRLLANEQGTDVAFSTHDENDSRLADHLYLMKEGATSRHH